MCFIGSCLIISENDGVVIFYSSWNIFVLVDIMDMCVNLYWICVFVEVL